MVINSMLSAGKYLAVLLVMAFVTFALNVYLFKYWLAIYLAVLLLVPMLGARPRMERSLLNAVFIGFYMSAIVSLIICLIYYYT